MPKAISSHPRSWAHSGVPAPCAGPDGAALSDAALSQGPRTSPLCVVLLHASREDVHFLRRILAYNARGFQTLRVARIEQVKRLLADHDVSAVICERDLHPGTWLDVLAALEAAPNPPLLIVTSSHVEEELWADVIHRGGFDILMKPFEAEEVLRVVGSASRAWEQGRTQRAHG